MTKLHEHSMHVVKITNKLIILWTMRPRVSLRDNIYYSYTFQKHYYEIGNCPIPYSQISLAAIFPLHLKLYNMLLKESLNSLGFNHFSLCFLSICLWLYCSEGVALRFATVMAKPHAHCYVPS
jgi:hypothetical protein